MASCAMAVINQRKQSGHCRFRLASTGMEARGSMAFLLNQAQLHNTQEEEVGRLKSSLTIGTPVENTTVMKK